jgi:non-specific serine/threonine protein kinase
MHRHWYDPMIEGLRRELGATQFEAIWDEGAALTIDQAVAEALSITADDAPVATATQAERSGIGATLSPREREVLKLVVQGASDQEIADALFISRRTASTHVGHIMNKLGVNSRVAVATFAVRSGLA